MRKKVIGKSIWLAGLLLMMPACAQACGVCMKAYFDYFMPPIKYWMYFCIVWFLCASLLTRKVDKNINRILYPGRALLLLVIAILAAEVAYGPMVILPLIVPPLIIFIRTFSKNYRAKIGRTAARNMLIFTVIMLVGVLLFATWSRDNRRTRKDVDFIVKWHAAGIGQSMIKQLGRQKPFPINDYCDLFEKGDDYVVWLALPGFTKQVDPEIGVPILINTLERLEKEGCSFYKHINESLCKLTKIDPAECSQLGTAAKWREAWKKKKGEKERLDK